MLQLETYRGTFTRHRCPSCGHSHCFARYQNERGEYLAEDVGRCNRESKCGYHKKPKEFYAENPQLLKTSDFRPKRPARRVYGFTETVSPTLTRTIKPDYIEKKFLLRTIGNYEINSFVSFFCTLFSEDLEAVEKAVKDYLIGTTKTGATVFWQIDGRHNVRTGKIIAYDATTGKRRKDTAPNWTHSELKKSGHLKPDFNLMQCFFGEHLLQTETDKPLAIVEAEKTAVIASVCFPKFIWLACGAKQNLNAEKLQKFNDRQIILYPDGDAFALWTEKAREARARGAAVEVSSLIERNGTDTQKANGYDLADYLISQQIEINEFNFFADDYNARLERVLNDEDLRDQFGSILDERKAVVMIDGNLSEAEAEKLLSNPTNIRQLVMSL